MKTIVTPRGGGKTHQLIELCAKHTSSLIVCVNKYMCNDVLTQAKVLGYDIPMPITYHEFLQGKYRGKQIESFLFDNVDLFLQSMTDVPVEAVSLTAERSDAWYLYDRFEEQRRQNIRRRRG